MKLTEQIAQMEQARKVAQARVTKAREQLSRALRVATDARGTLANARQRVAAAQERLADAVQEMRAEPGQEQLRIWAGETQRRLEVATDAEAAAIEDLRLAEASLKAAQRNLVLCEARGEELHIRHRKVASRLNERRDEAAIEEMLEAQSSSKLLKFVGHAR